MLCVVCDHTLLCLQFAKSNIKQGSQMVRQPGDYRWHIFTSCGVCECMPKLIALITYAKVVLPVMYRF